MDYLSLIGNALSLRQPQRESLEIFTRVTEILSLDKNPNLDVELAKVHEQFPTLTSFEREFPSICFSLATGVGKTRLMGACIACLYYAKGIKHFFVMASNLTIYDKLKNDLGNPENPKYVFNGLDEFATPPLIIDGDNYEDFRTNVNLFERYIVVNVFNIAKLNSDSKAADGKPARIKRLNEILGASYFDYLSQLPDLCIFMDESHHYHADKSFDVINELRPILGVELTATPQIQKGAKKILFKNVVYEYSLAHALNDGKYVKVPTVFTRRNFNPSEYSPEQLDKLKLVDGVRVHEDTKNSLETYARNNGKPVVKPFVLVVAKDTAHSNELLNYIKSVEFFGGRYADKVIEVNSALRGVEKDSNIKMLLSLEKPDNEIEIVIHVNMLKEGWDVTNLYTIVPLRASASETLTEQTIGRGLRLPYGERTGVDEVDRLSIISHDKYEAIVNLANDPNSLVRRISYIAVDDTEFDLEKEVIELIPKYNEAIQVSEMNVDFEVAKFITETAATSIEELNRRVKSFDSVTASDTKKSLTDDVVNMTAERFGLKAEEIASDVEKLIEHCVRVLAENVIPIPRIVIKPTLTLKQDFQEFRLNMQGVRWRPAEDKFVAVELQDGGQMFEYESEIADEFDADKAARDIVNNIAAGDNVDYSEHVGLLYKLVEQAREYFASYLSADDAVKVMRERQKTLAEMIHAQMNEHFYHEKVVYEVAEILPFSKIESGFVTKIKSDAIYDIDANLQPSEVPSKIFRGCNKSCYELCKFDSDAERTLARVLENDSAVLKWLRPAAKQFNIHYSIAGANYEPDFVVETADEIYIVEVKRRSDLSDADVKAKSEAAMVYCETATKFNEEHGGKRWRYLLLPHDEIHLNSSFEYLRGIL